MFSLLGTAYGGDGETTFGLPDLRGRVIKHIGNGSGLSNVSWGQIGGAETHQMTAAQLPSHTHSFQPRASSTDAGLDDPSGAYPATGDFYHGSADENMGASTTAPAGNNQPFGIRNPYLGVNVCIALVGIYPSQS